MYEKKIISGISCIGSGIGQSVINSIKLSKLPIKTIGLGSNPFAFGAFDCDQYVITCSIYEKDYIDNIINICQKQNIQLIIPGLDDEIILLSKNLEKFQDAGIKVICSGYELCSLCYDKEKMYNELNKVAAIFAKTYNKTNLEKEILSGNLSFPIFAKPRHGAASKEIRIINSIEDLNRISDNYIFQELVFPAINDPNYSYFRNQVENNKIQQIAEISIQLVLGKEGNLLGRMQSYNRLKNGVPIEIIPFKDESINNIIDILLPELIRLGLKGPLNIQGRLTENGLKIFEMNPRFTGISGMRALMGFNEVEACIKEWMDIDKGKNHIYLNHNRFGTRQISDKSIPIERSTGIISQFKHILSKEISRKTLLITGAGGYIGRNLIKMLAEDCSFNVWAYDIDKKRIEEIFKGKVQKVFDYNDLINGRMNLGYADILVHLGFARPYCTYLMIADSLKFTFDLFSLASMNQIPAILNFSSKSVYGMDNSLPWKESTPVVPQTVYAQAKYATELYLDTLKRRNNVLHFSSLRLSSISGGADGLTEVDALSKISRNAFKAEPIRIIGGSQLLEYLDIRDAVDAVIKMLKTDSEKWKPVYNIGANNKYKLTDIVEKSVNIAQKYNGGRKSEIIFENKDIDYKIDMDSSLFYNDFNWFPKYRIDDTIESLMVYFQKRERKV